MEGQPERKFGAAGRPQADDDESSLDGIRRLERSWTGSGGRSGGAGRRQRVRAKEAGPGAEGRGAFHGRSEGQAGDGEGDLDGIRRLERRGKQAPASSSRGASGREAETRAEGTQ